MRFRRLLERTRSHVEAGSARRGRTPPSRRGGSPWGRRLRLERILARPRAVQRRASKVRVQ